MLNGTKNRWVKKGKDDTRYRIRTGDAHTHTHAIQDIESAQNSLTHTLRPVEAPERHKEVTQPRTVNG